MRRKLIDLKNKRTTHLTAAQAALEAGNKETYDKEMGEVTALNEEIQRIENLINEQERFLEPANKMPAEVRDLAEARAETLRKGGTITYSIEETLAAFGVMRVTNATTLGSGTLVEPTRAGTLIRDRLSPVSSIIDQVSVVDLTGCGAILEPYVKEGLEAQAGKVTELAGTLRAESDPVLRFARIAPFEVNVTTYVDRNISNLSPANYEAKIRSLAMKALRQKVAELIYNGDGQATPEMYGIKTAKNTKGEIMYATVDVEANSITADTLMELYFAYGGDNELGGSAWLYCTKKDLKAIGELRGTNEKRRLFDITPNENNPNMGVIKDGGYIIPFVLSSGLTSIIGTTASDKPIQTMLYGNPLAYELGLFGNYSIRIDESYKAGERLLTILGDVMVGGNLVVDKSFVVATIPAAEG